MQSIDPSEQRRLSSTLDQLLLEGWALGYTTLREIVRRDAGEFEALFCPLHLPDRLTPRLERDSPVSMFWQALGMPGPPRKDWGDRGEPANTDFLAILRSGKGPIVLVLEFSLQAPDESEDFGNAQAHLDRLRHTVSRLENHGVFTRLGASVLGEQFAVSESVVAHLPALTSRDKPLSTNFVRARRTPHALWSGALNDTAPRAHESWR